jgi:hypothetical protein
MKIAGEKNTALKDDEKFLEGINLITGDKIDYAKHLLVQPPLHTDLNRS